MSSNFTVEYMPCLYGWNTYTGRSRFRLCSNPCACVFVWVFVNIPHIVVVVVSLPLFPWIQLVGISPLYDQNQNEM